jgi:hypothetical protein
MNSMSCASALKQILANSALAAGMPFRRFRAQYGLNDFLENVLLPTDDALVVAAKALHHFCTEDGQFNNCMFALAAILTFLKEETADSPADSMALAACQRELKALMSSNCSVDSLIEWTKRWYRL